MVYNILASNCRDRKERRALHNLRRFLLRKGLWVKFIRNRYEWCHDSGNMEYLGSVINGNPFGLIRRAFVWSKTAEGNKFWSKIDNEWRMQTDGPLFT